MKHVLRYEVTLAAETTRDLAYLRFIFRDVMKDLQLDVPADCKIKTERVNQ